MADSLLAVADLARINDVSIRDMGATDVFNDAPVLAVLNPITASHGTSHKFLKETGAPTVGFRAVGDGIDRSKSTDTAVTVDLKVLDAGFYIEAALARSNPKGIDYVLNRESRRMLRAAFSIGERQLFYGTAVDAAGFAGLADDATNLKYLNSAMVKAAGTPAVNQTLTDVWLIRTTDDERFLNLVLGNDGEIAVGDYYQQMIVGANSKARNCYVQPIEGWMTLATESTKAVARIVNIDDSACPLTDAILDRAIELFDENNPPTHIIMNKRSRRQLKNSRTATTATGAPAPTPLDHDGIPILVSKSIPFYAYADRIANAP